MQHCLQDALQTVSSGHAEVLCRHEESSSPSAHPPSLGTVSWDSRLRRTQGPSPATDPRRPPPSPSPGHPSVTVRTPVPTPHLAQIRRLEDAWRIRAPPGDGLRLLLSQALSRHASHSRFQPGKGNGRHSAAGDSVEPRARRDSGLARAQGRRGRSALPGSARSRLLPPTGFPLLWPASLAVCSRIASRSSETRQAARRVGRRAPAAPLQRRTALREGALRKGRAHGLGDQAHEGLPEEGLARLGRVPADLSPTQPHRLRRSACPLPGHLCQARTRRGGSQGPEKRRVPVTKRA